MASTPPRVRWIHVPLHPDDFAKVEKAKERSGKAWPDFIVDLVAGKA